MSLKILTHSALTIILNNEWVWRSWCRYRLWVGVIVFVFCHDSPLSRQFRFLQTQSAPICIWEVHNPEIPSLTHHPHDTAPEELCCRVLLYREGEALGVLALEDRATVLPVCQVCTALPHVQSVRICAREVHGEVCSVHVRLCHHQRTGQQDRQEEW